MAFGEQLLSMLSINCIRRWA